MLSIRYCSKCATGVHPFNSAQEHDEIGAAVIPILWMRKLKDQKGKISLLKFTAIFLKANYEESQQPREPCI